MYVSQAVSVDGARSSLGGCYAGQMQLRFEQLRTQFGETTALDIPALVIETGEFFTFAGPPGSGKSTALNLISGEVSPSAGRLMVGGSALDATPLGDRGVVRLERGDVLAPGGHTIAVFDEPLAGLDADQQATMVDELTRLHTRLKTTFVCATRDQTAALRLPGRMAVLRTGSIQQVGTPSDLIERPRNTFVASYVGDPPMNVVPGILEKDGVAVEVGARAFQLNGVVRETFVRDVFLGVRPEHVKVGRNPTGGWQGTVSHVESRGGRTIAEIRVDVGSFVACDPGAVGCRTGEHVAVQMAAKHLCVFDERGDRLEVV